MQIFATTGYEDGKEDGLNLIPENRKLSSGDYKLPHRMESNKKVKRRCFIQ